MQQHGSKYFACRPPPPPPTHTHTEHGHVAYQIKGYQVCSNMVANILPAAPPPPPPHTHPEHGHVAYQIKGNQVCSNMVANILPADPPHTHTHTHLPQNMVMLHIKLKVIGNAAKCFCRQTPTLRSHPHLGMGSKVQNSIFSNTLTLRTRLASGSG